MLAELLGACVGLLLHTALLPRVREPGHPNVIEASGQQEDSATTGERI
jgi:hypothetical protein